MTRWSIRRSAATSTVVGLTLLLAACGGGSDTTAESAAEGSAAPSAEVSTVEADETIAAMVPEAVRSKGTFTVATEGTYPPFELFAEDNTTLIGVDPDLATAVAGVMDLEVEFVNTKFDSIIPGLQAGRFDAGWASFGATTERQEVVDFVTYFQGGSTILFPAGNPKDLSIENLCGVKLAVQKGTIYESDTVPQLNQACLDAGEPEIQDSVYPAAPETVLAVSSGRADATISDLAPLAYAAKQSNGQFEVQEQQFNSIPWGVALPKGSELAEPLLAAVKKIMEDGAYMEILEKWEVQSGAITDPVINPTITPAG
jgi:polar amino acid transport system substrate-binding protein